MRVCMCVYVEMRKYECVTLSVIAANRVYMAGLLLHCRSRWRLQCATEPCCKVQTYAHVCMYVL